MFTTLGQCSGRGDLQSSANGEAGKPMSITRNEEFWIEVIRQASHDTDPPPNLARVQKVRAIFRD
jgi:hypothetical protein